MNLTRIAILGATSHIAKGLIAAWGTRKDRELFLYARRPEQVRQFAETISADAAHVLPVDEFGILSCDVVINCIGIADPGELAHEMATIFTVTETWDTRVLAYLAKNPETLYINFSSGAAYGSDFSQPVDESSAAVFPANALTPAEFYGIAKLHAEARHRAAADLNIVDLRVFSYFSRFIDLSTRFLTTDILAAIKEGKELLTTPANIIRDYVHPQDLAALLDCVIRKRGLNGVYDVYSRGPATKFEILERFAAEFGLRYRVMDGASMVTATGTKDHYYSLNRRAAELGFEPQYESIGGLLAEVGAMMSQNRCLTASSEHEV